jgi:ribosome maturation factor RimP
VEVSLFQAKDGKKKFEGLLKDFQDGSAVVEVKGIGELAFKKEEISWIHKAVRFG